MKLNKLLYSLIVILSIVIISMSCVYRQIDNIEGKICTIESEEGIITILFMKGNEVEVTYDQSKTLEGSYSQNNDEITVRFYDYEYVLSYNGDVFTVLSVGYLDEKTDNYDSSKHAIDEVSIFMHDDIERTYVLKLPKVYKSRPLVMVLHGFGGEITTIDNYMEFGKLGEENDFVVCYPQGLSGKEKDGAYWNANWGVEGDPDDIGFLVSLAQSLADEYELDENSIYVCGYSNGGFMSYTLALNAPDIFSKVAVMSGLMSEYDWRNREQAEAVSILHIHGGLDTIIEIEDSEHYKMSARDIVDFWREVNGADEMTMENIGDNTKAYKYPGPNSDVWYYKVDNWGHDIPTKEQTDFNATELIWSFFESAK